MINLLNNNGGTIMKKLLNLFVIIFVLVSLANSQDILFQDDFEDGNADGWELDIGWQVKLDSNNYVLCATEGSYANLDKLLIDYSFVCRIKEIEGRIRLQYRINSLGRYFIYFDDNAIYLGKEKPWDSKIILASTVVGFHKNQWYEVKVSGQGGNLKIYVNNIELIDYTDTDDPNLFGRIGFETGGDQIDVYIDDVLITGELPPTVKAKWEETGGPVGGIGYDVRVNQENTNILYATDAWSGIHKSYDQGESWEAINSGIITKTGATSDAIPVFSATIDPINPDIIWCGTQNILGIYRSVDGGNNWEKRDNGVSEFDYGIAFRSFVVDPYNSDIVYAGSEIPDAEMIDRSGTLFKGTTKGKIYKTIDGGLNWFVSLDAKALFRHILIDYTNPEVIYAATGIHDRIPVEREGAFKSLDGGNNWFKINDGFPLIDGVLNVKAVTGLTMHPIDPNILYAVTVPPDDSEDTYAGVYKTLDGGENWQELLKRDALTQVELSFTNPEFVYVAGQYNVFVSEDEGTTWKEYDCSTPGTDHGIPIRLTVDPVDPDIVYINNYNGGVFKSIDRGKTWNVASNGYTGAHVYDMAVDPNKPSIVYAVDRVGPFKSYTGGKNWTGINYGDAKNEHEYSVVKISPFNSQVIFLGSRLTTRIFKSTNGGRFFKRVLHLPDSDGHCVNSMDFSKQDPNIMFASIGRPEGSFVDFHSLGVLKSNDGGNTWEQKNNGLETTLMNINDIIVDCVNTDIIYVATFDAGIYKSNTGGDSWDEINNGITNFDIRCLAQDKNNPTILYAGVEHGAVFKTEDSGGSWVRSNMGMYSESSIRSIVIDPQNTNIIYAYDYTSGVFRSTDQGKTWFHINDGLRIRAGRSLAISNDGKVLYAGTEGGGVFRLVLDNSEPQVILATPDTSDTIELEKGSKITLEVQAFDLNDDTLTYVWKMNDLIMSEKHNSLLNLDASNFMAGVHKIIVEISDGATKTIVSWKLTIVPSENPVVTIISPNGTEIWPFNSHQEITWTATDNATAPLTVTIQYTTADTSSWQDIATNVANDGFLEWDIPYDPSEECKLRILAYDIANNVGTDESDSTFSIPALFLTDVKPSTYVPAYLNVGDNYYIDRHYIITSIPDELQNLLWIKTANNDKHATSERVVSFTVNKDVAVYVGYDRSFPDFPQWLSSWENTGLQIRVSDGIEGFEVFKNIFQAGEIVLGGYFASDYNSMYLVLLQSDFQTDIEQIADKILPVDFCLHQNFPNPFNPTTTIKYQLPKTAKVVLKIFNLLGQEIKTLVNDYMDAGFYSVQWNGSNNTNTLVSSGVYICRVEFTSKSKQIAESQKMVLLQ
jgi:photosystem II stability/assembly factor-like uncharacterized protein